MLTAKEWFDAAPDGIKTWMHNITFLRFLREEMNARFQMPGRYDGAMSETCKASFRAQFEQMSELLVAIKESEFINKVEPTTEAQMSAEREMPRYKCHKEVHALQIRSVTPDASAPQGAGGSCIMVPEETGYGPIRLDEAFCRKHNPQAGGYYVVYDDGYASYSPAKPFEEGYTRIS